MPVQCSIKIVAGGSKVERWSPSFPAFFKWRPLCYVGSLNGIACRLFGRSHCSSGQLNQGTRRRRRRQVLGPSSFGWLLMPETALYRRCLFRSNVLASTASQGAILVLRQSPRVPFGVSSAPSPAKLNSPECETVQDLEPNSWSSQQSRLWTWRSMEIRRLRIDKRSTRN